MSLSHRIIDSGPALVLCPKIKQHFGVSAALVLQQLHYWLSKENLSYGIIDEAGYQWIRNSYEQWCEQIQVLTLSTLRRAFSTLIEKNIILSQRFSEKSRYAGGNQVKFYTINYDQLESIMGDLGKASINRPSHFPSQTHGAGDTSSRTTVHNSQNLPITAKKPSTHKSAQNRSKQPNHLLKMNTLPAQNEQSLYITNTTSENTSKKTSLTKTSQQIEKTKLQVVDVETIQPDKPAEREKINIVEDMISFWNEIIEQTPNKIVLTAKRSQHLNAAFKHFFNSNLADWETFCCKIASSKFLMGDVKAFKANLDWSIRFETIQRILEGGYSFGDRESNYKLKLNQNCLAAEAKTLKTSANVLTPAIIESSKALAIRENIKKKISPPEYSSWFLETEISVDENEDGYEEAVICVSTRFKGDRIQTTYRDIYEQHFNAYFVGTAEQYVNSKNIHTPINNTQTTAPTDMPSLNKYQQIKVAPETCVAHLREECAQITLESPSEEEFAIEVRGNPFNEEAHIFLKTEIIEGQMEKGAISQEDISPRAVLMYEEHFIVDKVECQIASHTENIHQVQMDTNAKLINVTKIVDKCPAENQNPTVPKTQRCLVNHLTSLIWFKNIETNTKKGRGVVKFYPTFSKQGVKTQSSSTLSKFSEGKRDAAEDKETREVKCFGQNTINAEYYGCLPPLSHQQVGLS